MTRKLHLSQMVLEGRYQPGTTLLHGMRPSFKVAGALAFVLLASWGHLQVLVGLLAVCLLMMALAHVPYQIVGRMIYAFRWLFLVIWGMPLVTVPGLPIEALQILPFDITWEGLWTGSESLLKIMVMFFLSMVLVRTTSPNDLMSVLQKAVIIPHPRWKQRVEEFFLTGLWAVQLIPMICVETETFLWARFEEENKNNISGLKKAWRTASQLGPLMAHLLQRMDEWEPTLTGKQDWESWQSEAK